MKSKIFVLPLIIFSIIAYSQQSQEEIYRKSDKYYNAKDFVNSAKEFDKIKLTNLSNVKLYNGACIYSLNNEKQKALKILDLLAFKKDYSNFKHISTDTDLKNLYTEAKWKTILEKVKSNFENSEKTKLLKIYSELSKAKVILEKDNGKLWGQNIWSDDILVLDYDNTIYSLNKFLESQTADGRLFFAKIPNETLVFVNTVQKYKGKDYAVVLSNYLSDNSTTIIHELFHLLQYKNLTLKGDAIKYLDNYDAREFLRLEYQALRNTLNSINHKKSKSEISQFLEDALRYRKIRQSKYKELLDDELQIETLEGLANYTGFKLSSKPNLYESAISEIYNREDAQTYTRPFPYATGVAYGLIYDYLKLNWKSGLKKVYNFLEIYENNTNKNISVNESLIAEANKRNNFTEINREETDRKLTNEKNIEYYKDLLSKKPTLSVKIADIDNYGRSFNMNGTIEVPNLGTVYSGIKGRDISGKNFGNFKTLETKSKLGEAGVLITTDNKIYFPMPFKTEDNKLIGETYEITLNKDWKVEKINEKGDYEIKKTE